MDAMAARFQDQAVRSVFVYTREAHPGENYGPHRKMADKRHHARAFQSALSVQRPILLDDLSGTTHRGYGLLPNMTWIISRGGLILYKGAWTDPVDIENALVVGLDVRARRQRDHLVPFYSERLAWRTSDDAQFRAGLERAGPQAVRDFYGEKA